ncbi:MAG: class E sortase [Armatimonadota bacterium]
MRILGLEETRALSAALLVCGMVVLVAPWALVAVTGREVNAAQAQALSSWDETVLQSPSSASQPGAEDGRLVLSIPSLDLRRFVPNDATPDHLKAYGVGWMPWTAVPGADGVVGIAGHRTTYGAPFFRLDTLMEGDAILIDYRGRRYTYRVERFETVSPTQVEVLQASPDQRMIALVTCTPVYSAASRLVVLGRLDTVAALGSGQ